MFFEITLFPQLLVYRAVKLLFAFQVNNGGGGNRSRFLFSTNIFRLSYQYWPRNDLTARGSGGGGILNVIVKLFLLLAENRDGNDDIGRFLVFTIITRLYSSVKRTRM